MVSIRIKKEVRHIQRNSFIQISKLPNVIGRINYITSTVKQENLYATYETAELNFWKDLAKYNQEEFKKSGTKGKCIEAREFIIALPESFINYDPDVVLQLFTDNFKQTYHVECTAALHHNKQKTNYHIHLIFSERQLLEQPIEKIAARNMYFNENGDYVRTKKEILDANGNIRANCGMCKKGDIYHRVTYTPKYKLFKQEQFLDEVKLFYTNLINTCLTDKKEKLCVFDKNGVYLPTKKIGKNNPKEQQIKENNQCRTEWNQTVDIALVNGVEETQIKQVKKREITDKIRESIKQKGRQGGQIFSQIVKLATAVLILLINKKNMPPMPKISTKAHEFSRLAEIYDKMLQQNEAIFQKEQQLCSTKKALDSTKGIFRGKQQKELQASIDILNLQISNKKNTLSGIVRRYGFETAKQFMDEYNETKSAYKEYQKSVLSWKAKYGDQANPDIIESKPNETKEQLIENAKALVSHCSLNKDAR